MNDTGNKNRAVESECDPFHLSQLRGAQSIVFTRENTIFSCLLPSVQDTIFQTML